VLLYFFINTVFRANSS